MISRIIAQLAKLEKNGRLGHAYIIEGMELNTESWQEIGNALGVGEQDVSCVNPQGTVSISIDQIRILQDRLSRKPISGMHIVLISPADRMNQAASNALLKLLEEPPGSSCFLLFTNNQRQLMQTIRSRSQVLYCDVPVLDSWITHDEYPLIKVFYTHCPALLTDTSIPLAIELYKNVLHSSTPLLKIHDTEHSAVDVLKATLIIVATAIIQNPENNYWAQYDRLLHLCKISQRSHNLNEKALLDHAGYAISQIKLALN